MTRDKLQKEYIESIIDGMDHKTMYQYVFDMLEQNIEKYSDKQLRAEVKDRHPELLDSNI